MPIPPVRYCLVMVVALSFSGCYSGGRWSMPNLAVWKSNPFSPSSRASGPEAVPRPSEIASQPGPAPGSGYATAGSKTAGTLAPPYAPPPAQLAEQQNYPVTQPAGGRGPLSYMTPQQGYYDPSPSSGLTASHTPTGPHTAPTSLQGGSPPGPASFNPYAASAPFGAAPSTGPGHAYGSPGTSAPGYMASNPSGPYANPVREDARDSYDARLADYRSTAGAYGSPIPDYQSGGGRPTVTPDYRDPQPDYRNHPAAAAAYNPGAPHSPAAGSPAPAYGGNTPHGYYPADHFAPGTTGYQPQGVPPYHSPAGTTAPATDSGYSPGSVGRYDPYLR